MHFLFTKVSAIPRIACKLILLFICPFQSANSTFNALTKLLPKPRFYFTEDYRIFV